MQYLFRRWGKKFLSRTASHYPIRSASGRVLLSPLQKDEIRFIESWFQDRETCELAFGVKAPWDVLSTIREEYIEELQKDKVGVLSVYLEKGNKISQPIGFVRYKLFEKGRRRQARVGIILGPPRHRGRGIGKEAFQTLLDYLFEQRNVKQIELDTATFNLQAQACFRACGFEPVREMEFTSINTQWTEKRLVMRLSKQQWEAAR